MMVIWTMLSNDVDDDVSCDEGKILCSLKSDNMDICKNHFGLKAVLVNMDIISGMTTMAMAIFTISTVCPNLGIVIHLAMPTIPLLLHPCW